MKSWFAGTASSVNSEIITPFSNAEQIIYKYNQAIEHNSLTQQGWQRLIAQCDDGLVSYLTNIKGSTASMSAYSVSLQGNITGYTKITQAMKQYNALGVVSQKEQQNFATAVSLTNTKLGSYLTGLNGAKASLSGYGISLVASTAKTVGLTIATTALNAALTFGISAIITGVVSAFATWINSSKKITEAAEEAKDKISSINDDLKSNTETVENAKQRYAELAQEVENLGQVSQSRGSLSTDEYEEFLDLSNQLAGVFPQLTKGYDDNGNAILDLSGNVDTIVGSLDDLLQKEKDLANQKIMDEFPDVYKGYVKDLEDAESEVESAKKKFDDINSAYSNLDNGRSIQMGFLSTGYNKEGTMSIGQYENWLETLGLTYEETVVQGGKVVSAVGDINDAFTSQLETARKNLQYAEQQLEGEKSSIDSYLNTWLQSEFTYNQIDDSGLQTAVQDMIMNFDFSSLPKDKRNNWDYVSEYLRRNILFAINDVQDDPEISKAISEVFTNQDLTPEEKANYLQQIKDYFDDLLGKDNAISISLQPQIDDTDAYKKKTNEALAVALWGENYEKLILQNRTQDIEAFKDKYLEIQSKIDDNKSLIDSYQEKVDYYNKLKEQWSDISSAYEKEQQRMYAAQILGANWEKDVLDGRLDVLSQFRDQYLEIQRQMTQAALDGARARNDAAASGGTGGSGGSSGGGGGSTPIQNQQAYHVLHLVGGYSTSGEASSKISSFNGKGVYKYKDGKWYVYKEEDYSNLSFGSKSEADDYIKKHLSPAGKFLVKYYHNGLENGLVDFSKKDSNFDLVQKYGLKKYEVPAILKQGEAVMNQEQIKNLGEALRAIPTAATLYTTPDYTKMLSSLKTNNTPVMVTQSVNITLPNVTNNSGYENLTRELNRLKLDAYQFANRRN